MSLLDTWTPLQGCFVPSWLKLAQWFWRRFLIFVNVYLLHVFPYYLYLKKGVVIHLNKLVDPLSLQYLVLKNRYSTRSLTASSGGSFINRESSNWTTISSEIFPPIKLRHMPKVFTSLRVISSVISTKMVSSIWIQYFINCHFVNLKCYSCCFCSNTKTTIISCISLHHN